MPKSTITIDITVAKTGLFILISDRLIFIDFDLLDLRLLL